MLKYKHAEYLATLDGKPHLILCHLSIQYLGFLFGGQAIARHIAKSWGKEAVALYKYDKPAQVLRTFEKQMNQYLVQLPDAEYQAYLDERTVAWQLATDHLDVDTRLI